MLTSRRAWLLLPALALLPLILYASLGYGGHDFSYHVTAWNELHHAWASHDLVLGWSPLAQHGFGEPSFCFYPPFSLLIGSAFSFLLPMRLVPGAIVWVILSLSGLTMYSTANGLRKQHRLLAAVLYMFNPYLLVTVMIRYAIAEAWVQALLPLTFLCFYQAVAQSRVRAFAPLVLLFAFGWLTNIPEAIAVFYSFGLLAAVLFCKQRSWRPLVVTALSQAAALLLAAFRLGPALVEKQWVASDALLLHNFRNYMQLRRIPPPNLLVYFCGAFMLIASLIGYLAIRNSASTETRWTNATLCLFTLSAFAVVMQLPLSTPLWQYMPQVKYLQFPFRFLPFLSLGTVLLLCANAVPSRLRNVGSFILLSLSICPLFAYTRLLPFQRFESLTSTLIAWDKGFEGVREYVPIGVPATRALPINELALQKQGPFTASLCHPLLVSTTANKKIVAVSNLGGCTLTLNTFYYPFWKASLENGIVISVKASIEGLLQVQLPAGTHTVTLSFMPQTRVRALSATASFITCIMLCLWIVIEATRRGRVPRAQRKAYRF